MLEQSLETQNTMVNVLNELCPPAKPPGSFLDVHTDLTSNPFSTVTNKKTADSSIDLLPALAQDPWPSPARQAHHA